MKFDQAYYTWDWEQLTKYQGGLGIHASSNRDSTFLMYCMNLASKLKPEPHADTAQLLLYSEELGYVGAFISPREDVSGKNRSNMLCHLFVPAEKRTNLKLEEYLVEYPYVRTMGESRVLDRIERNPEAVKRENYYNKLLEKYCFTPEKMAVLIWRLYQRLFDEISKVPMIISKEVHSDKREYAQIAREITWLISCLTPRQEFIREQWYKKLTYGVYTEANIGEISLYYTDENGWKNAFFIDGSYEIREEDMPLIFEKMGELACHSLEDLQNFVEELQKDNYKKHLYYDLLDILYESWKLKHGISLTEEQLFNILPELIRGSGYSEWHEELLYKAIANTEIQSGGILRALWTTLALSKQRIYKDMIEEKKAKFHSLCYVLLNKMYSVSEKDYTAALNSLEEDCKKKVLEKILEDDQSLIIGELEQMRDVDSLRACVKKYDGLCEFETVAKRILIFAQSLYEKGDKKERTSLSDCMLESRFCDNWNSYLEQWFTELKRDYLNLLEKEEGRIENRFLEKCYEYLFYYGQQAGPMEREDVLKRERILREEGKAFIGNEYIVEFQILERNWTILKEVQYLKDAPLETLLERPLRELKYDKCYEQWFISMKRFLNGFLKYDDFEQILKYRTESWELVIEGKLPKESWDSFDKSLRNLLTMSQANLKWRFLYFTNSPCNKISEIWTCVWFDEYDSFYELLETYPECRQMVIENTDDSKHHDAYFLWEKVYQGYEICLRDIKAIKKGRSFDMNQFLNKLEDVIVKKEWVTLADLTNICVLQCVRFRDSRKSLTQRIKRHQELLQKNLLFSSLLQNEKEISRERLRMEKDIADMLEEMSVVNQKIQFEQCSVFDLEAAVKLRKRMESIWDKKEVDSLQSVIIMKDNMEKHLSERKKMIGGITESMNSQMEKLKDKRRQEKELFSQLEACQRSISEINSQLEISVKQAEKIKSDYKKDCDIMNIQPDSCIKELECVVHQVHQYGQDLKAQEKADEKMIQENVEKQQSDKKQIAECQFDKNREAEQWGEKNQLEKSKPIFDKDKLPDIVIE